MLIIRDTIKGVDVSTPCLVADPGLEPESPP